MMCNSPSYNVSASTREPFTTEYHSTLWTTRPVILDDGTIRRFLVTAGPDCTGKVVSREKLNILEVVR
ncbi:hypothetical protein E2C01_066047 [Portunus trituberculatus]|uniref:Uncharacterized protein n=1 Tax=Portunus trituberculatus TaxID=210409 RepID=A0A5B7HKG6_PORTR|nr:hypothetical protein [Portunus trituberculatus]